MNCFGCYVILIVLISSSTARPEDSAIINNNANCTDETGGNVVFEDTHQVHTKNIAINSRLANKKSEDRINPEDQAILFPDRYHNVISRMTPPAVGSLKGKRNCINNICDEVDNYPAEYITNLLKQTDAYNIYFKDTADASASGIAFDIADRFGPGDENTICPTIGHKQYPKTAPNINKSERIIINVEGYRQGLVFETCTENAKCMFSETFPLNYESNCRQRYVIRNLMALDENNKPAYDSFEVPSCCVCTYKKKGT